MVGIVDRAVVLLDIGHQVVGEVEAEDVLAEHGLRHTSTGGRCGQQLIGIAVGQHHDHLLCLPLCQEVVEDIVHAAYLIIYLFCIRRTADAVEHGVFLILVLLVLWGQIDDGLIGGTQVLRVVMDIFYLSVGHVLDVVRQTALAGRNLQQAVLETLVGEVQGILGVHHAHTVDDEAVGVHVWGGRTQGDGPQSRLGVVLHGVAPCELHIDQHLLGLVVLVLECHGAVCVADGLRLAGRGTQTTNHH